MHISITINGKEFFFNSLAHVREIANATPDTWNSYINEHIHAARELLAFIANV